MIREGFCIPYHQTNYILQSPIKSGFLFCNAANVAFLLKKVQNDNIKNMFIICSSGFILNSKNEFLMLRRSSDDNFLPDYWELPGGRLEMGEDLVVGLEREVKEESGLDVEVLYPLKVVSYYLDPENPRESYGVFYFCKLQDKNQKISVSEEHSDCKWVSFDNFKQLKITNFLKKLIEDFKNHPLVESNLNKT